MKNKDLFKKVILWITYAIVLSFLLLNIKTVYAVFKAVMGVLSPIFIGILLAYILNFLYEFFRKKCFKKIKTKKGNTTGAKVLSLVCTYAVALGIIAFLLCILIPELINSGKQLFYSVPSYINSFKNSFDSFVKWVNETFKYDLYDGDTIAKLADTVTKAIAGVNFTDWLSQLGKSAFPVVINFSTGIYNWILGLIVSIYLLSSKEILLRQARKFIVAYTPKRFYKSFFNICTISNKKFGKFLMGQILDAILVGVLCFIGLSILKIDYALLIGFLVGVTNVIPFFGPFLGGIPSALLLFIIDPWQCLWFIIFIICLQQIDGNFIYPRIVGESVGIQSFWIVFSVILGGGLFGVPGMLLGVPVFATVYTILQRNTLIRLKKKSLADCDYSDSKDFVSKDYIAVRDEEKPPVKRKKFVFFKKMQEQNIADETEEILLVENDINENDQTDEKSETGTVSKNDENITDKETYDCTENKKSSVKKKK